MSQETTSYSEYRNGVKAVAASVIERVRTGEDPSEVLHEEVDGSWWIIYTHAARAVLEHSRNDDAVFDEGIGLDGCDSMADVYTRAAFYAMAADVIEELRGNGYDVSDPDTFATDDDDAAVAAEGGAE